VDKIPGVLGAAKEFKAAESAILLGATARNSENFADSCSREM
jgi:hypothetical protein